MLKNAKIALGTLVGGTLMALSLTSIAQSSWQVWVKTHYAYIPSPYTAYFLVVRDCTWQYTTSQGGNWGVVHYYTAQGSCPVSEQQIVWSKSGGYNNTTIYHR